ncbi:MAG: hypothetical protein QXU32_12290 [Nitrososphaerales archaeon]
MYRGYLFAALLAFMILFSSSVPVYASHMMIKEASADEKRLFEKVLARLEHHSSIMQVQIDDVKKTLAEPIKIFFSCRSFKEKQVESVSISVRTHLASFDQTVAEKHASGVLSGVYMWDCAAVKDRYTLTIECVNKLMLNPAFLIKEETETDESKIIAMVENEVVLYHEFLHGELMINAMNDASDSMGWRKDACTFFGSNDNKIDYAPSDGEHKVISAIELDYLARRVNEEGGKMIIKSIEMEDVGGREFTQLIATFDELGPIAKRAFFVFARGINLVSAEVLVSMERGTVSIKGLLDDPSKNGIVRVFVIPKTNAPYVTLYLTVDDIVKASGSTFVFTVNVQNLQRNDVSGVLRLGINGFVVATKEVSLPANGMENVRFVWESIAINASKHVATIDGFNTASNEVTFYTFNRFQSITVHGNGVVTEQTIIDAETGNRILVAKPSRISGTAIVNGDMELRLIAPDGTAVIGKDALIKAPRFTVDTINIAGTRLILKYTELNDRILFFAVKPANSDVALPSGTWSVRAVDADGNDADTRIKYYVNYVGNM